MEASRILATDLKPDHAGHIETDDQVRLAFQTFGHGPPIVFANGIGVRYPGAHYQISALTPYYQVICWDYRGMGESVMQNPYGDVSMPRQAQDILAILDFLQLESAIFIGWSMGVQVALEAIRLASRRVAGFVALLGSYGKPCHAAFPTPLAEGVEGLFIFASQYPSAMQAIFTAATRLPQLAFSVLSRMRIIGRDIDQNILQTNIGAVAEIEKGIYSRTLLALEEHDAFDVLPTINCPSLVIGGEQDYLTPPRVARLMVQHILDATYKEIKGGTHFALIEQPELINGWLLEFAHQIFGAK